MLAGILLTTALGMGTSEATTADPGSSPESVPAAAPAPGAPAGLADGTGLVAPPPAILVTALGTDALGQALMPLYAARNFVPVWMTAEGASPRGKAVLASLSAAAAEGLDPTMYQLDAIHARLAVGTPENELVADALISRAFVLFACDRLLGQTRRLVPFDQRADLLSREEGWTIETLIGNAAAAPDPKAFLASLEPASPQYRLLIAALARWQARAPHTPAAAPIAEGPSLRPGDRGPRVAAARQRLIALGELTAGASRDASLFDDAMTQAVRAFQTHHGLAVDGVLGPASLGELTRGGTERVDQIRVALERWRLLPRDLGAVNIFVNVPQYELFLNAGPREALRMPVAVGRPNDPTPLFSDEIEYMEFNPYWNVPISIAREEVIPRQVEDPAYLARRGFTVLPRTSTPAPETASDAVDWERTHHAARAYRLRQDPGPSNPLGSVKFMFPNQYAVYLHDTNSRAVFSRSFRAVSHGCVRVQDPAGLADYLLAHFTARPGQSAASFRGPRPRVVRLAWRVPVHLAYITAWADTTRPGAPLRFNRDVYDLDPALYRRLEQAASATGESDAVAVR
ncbi:L,D-transpeptidase family protein [Pararhodospirillum oryzae]|uniref:Murein L,D-transpeptidase n=1 Tax=Pararhodospirillum oryzae TaxID=478448 RepID=A0A512H3L3_9PROT|nr:L,D-transpeptidase family protein [Pararhodospirillum oryzae]GEO79990.1 murein L,D-transpeptidase [Pararhodospirillum oryzae]